MNTAIFMSKVKSLLLNAIHVMIWAVQVTSPDDFDEYQQRYSNWLQTLDNQLKQLLPTIMHQLFINDTAYNFRIKPYYDDGEDVGFTATDSFEKDGFTLQRLIFPIYDIQPDDSVEAQWQAPPVMDVIKGLAGRLRDVSKRNQFKVNWNIDQFVKADIGKLNPSEPMMSIGSMQTSYYMKDAIDGDYTFTQDDAVLTTDVGIILALIAQPDWNNRNNWRLQNTAKKLFMATGIQHPTTDYMLRDLSEHLLRFFNSIDDYAFSTRWVFEIAP